MNSCQQPATLGVPAAAAVPLLSLCRAHPQESMRRAFLQQCWCYLVLLYEEVAQV